ncbi:MAG: hypothetical protein JXM79_12595, partial [Sedimentisphaerales bacterium]|nr:hypothetical protein [Sedimentisphaerales bacterium]
GCEIVSGLCELYVTVSFASPEKKKQYEQPIHEMLHRILEIGRNEDGLFYNSVNPKTGHSIDKGISDTWGYVFNAFYAVYLIDKTDAYRDAVLLALSNLKKYRNFDWEQGAADGFADAIEGAINLYNREALPHVKEWIDGETKILWSLQDTSYRQEAQQWKNTGIIDGSHCDGNFARTTLMYCLWKTQGVTVSPWREDVVFGAVYKNGVLFLSIKVDHAWEGKIVFDRPRHQTVMKLPLDWPRINQFPEWFIIDSQSHYEVNNLNINSTKQYNGSGLTNGMFLKLDPDIHYRLKATKR